MAWNVEYFNCLDSRIPNARYTSEILRRIAMEKHIQKQEDPLHQIIGRTFKEENRKVLYMEYSFVWW
jgi:hypothetical protein